MMKNKYILFIDSLFIMVLLAGISFLLSHKTLDNQLIIRFNFLSAFILSLTFYLIIRKHSERYRVIQLPFEARSFIYIYAIYTLLSGLSLFHTINLSDGIFELCKIVLLGILVFLLTIMFSNQPQIFSAISKIICLLGIIVCTIGMIDLFHIIQTGDISHTSLYQMTGTFGHKNLFSEVLFYCFPFGLYAGIVNKGIWRIVAISCGLMLLFLITISMTRTVWVAMIAAIFFTVIVDILVKKKKGKWYKGVIMVVVIFSIVLGSAAIYSKLDNRKTFAKQLASIMGFSYGSTKDRLILWSNSIKLAKENPYLGQGLASWKIHILKYGNQNLKSEDNLTFYQRPHNDYIWVLCEQGCITLLFFLALFLYPLWICLKSILKSNSFEERMKGYLIFFLLIGYLVISFFNFPKERIEHIVFQGIMFSLIFSFYVSISRKIITIKMSPYYIFPIILVSLVIFLFGCFRFRNEAHFRKALQSKNRGHWERVIREIDQSNHYFYRFDPFSTPLFYYRGISYFNLGNVDQAMADFTETKALNPYHIHNLNNLGTCYAIKEQYDIAKSLYREALIMAPNFEDALYNMSVAWMKENNIDSARFYFLNINEPKNVKRYDDFYKVLIINPLNKFWSNIDDPGFKDTVYRIITDDIWLKDIINKSKLNKIPIEKQLVLDAVYVLKEDNSITESIANFILEKYK